LTRFVGLTGGIGAGKSEALAAFERLGAETLSTDLVAHDLLADEEIRGALVGRWGEQVAPAGEVDRERIAGIVFEDPGELAWLEGQLHPRVGAKVLEWSKNVPPEVEVAVVEVPLLFEAGMDGTVDATVAVVADDEIRDRRLRERGQGGLSGREERQLSQAEKENRADHVIRNNGTLGELESQVGAVMKALGATRVKP
jgi:dephospho-CoA kinase